MTLQDGSIQDSPAGDWTESRDSVAADKPIVDRHTAFRFWLKLGLISFGGPAGQIAIMHRELVEQRRWISERRFMHALNYCLVLPGPEAQQLATYIGWLMHGWVGGFMAGGLFVLPSLLLLMGLSAIYIAYGSWPWVAAGLAGVKPVVVAIVLSALVRIGGRTLRSWPLLGLAAIAFLGLAWGHWPFPAIVLGAAGIGWLGSRIFPAAFLGKVHSARRDGQQPADSGGFLIDDVTPLPRHAVASWRRSIRVLACGLIAWTLPLAGLVMWQGWEGVGTRMALFFSVAALVTFGGAYAVLPYVSQQAVEVYGWLQRPQMIDGLALGESTPGPLIMVVAFVGFVGGYQTSEFPAGGAIVGALVATYFTFLPSFVFIFLGAPWIERSRGELNLAAALNAISAAVVGVILNLACSFASATFWPDRSPNWSQPLETIQSADLAAMAVTLLITLGLVRFRWNVVATLVAGVGFGLLYYGWK